MVSTMNCDYQISLENKYKLLLNKRLGSGAFGDVFQGKVSFYSFWLGINVITHSNVAIKIVSQFYLSVIGI